MSDQYEYESLIDESARRRFEQAWLDGHPQPIESFLPAESDNAYLPTLEELVHIELEFAWSAYAARARRNDSSDATLAQAPLVESYLHRFPLLNDPAVVARLIEQELRVRGDAGQTSSLDDYRRRFPELMEADGPLASKLETIVAQLAAASTGETRIAETQAAGTAPMRDRMGEDLPRRFGNYELLEELGRGGMGVVYRARQLSADRIVSLKVIRRDWLQSMPNDARTGALDRFRHEAQAAARIEHEHIVRVYEVGAVEGEPFFSMQFVDGQSLAESIADGPLAGRRAATLMEAVARAVDEAHRRGILHRDLKPQNILVERQTNSPLVADFGLAKLVQANDALTCAGDIMGSPPYMSPEQAQDSSLVTTQSDVYALGATLYHTLTGKPPFRADTVLDTLVKVVGDEPVPLRQINPEIDPDLETICLKCLQKEPPRRYATAAALADDLQCYLDGNPIAAHPVGTLERCRLWCRRNPLVATLTASTAIFLMLTLVASVVGYFQTSAALDTAEAEWDNAQQRHRQTRQVINDYFTRISEDRLLNEPGMQPLRQELLQEVLPHYRNFLVEFADDASIRDELALTHFRIGLITEDIEGPQEALPCYNRARQMQEEILDQRPADGQCLRNLGNTLTAIGPVLQRQGQHDEARDVYQQAIVIRKRLVQQQADDNEARRMLANSHMNLGLLERDVGNPEGAIAPYQQAQQIRQQILEDDRDNHRTRRDLGMGFYNSAVVALMLADLNALDTDPHLADAHQRFRKAASVFEELLKDDPRDLSNQRRLVLSYRMLADLASVQQDFQAAETLYEKALGRTKTLALRSPDVPDFQADLAALYMNLSQLSEDRGDRAVARERLERAEEVLAELVQRFPRVPRYRYDLAVTLRVIAGLLVEEEQVSEAGRHLQSARSHLEQLVAAFPENREFAQELARAGEALGIPVPR